VKSDVSFLLILLIPGIMFCILCSTIVVIAAEENTRRSDANISKTIPATVSHVRTVKPVVLLQVKTNLEKSIQAIKQGDKQGALSHLTIANSQLSSINTLGGGGDRNTRSADASSIQSVKISTKNAIHALQSNDIKISTQGILYLKSAHSKLSAILGGGGSSSPI